MGYLRHECIVVSGWDKEAVEKARASAVAIFRPYEMEGLVGGVIPHAMNGGAAFLIAPDGSKEGWLHSNQGAEARLEFMSVLRHLKDRHYVDWALLLIGGDDGEYRVLASPSGAEKADAA